MSALDDVSVGVDIQEIAAFEDHADPSDLSFYERVFTRAERDWCNARPHPAQHLAARFAAKEAVVKALSEHAELGLEQVEVLRAADGQPRVRLLCEHAASYRVKISMSHSDTQAVAVAIAERRTT